MIVKLEVLLICKLKHKEMKRKDAYLSSHTLSAKHSKNSGKENKNTVSM